MRLSALLPVLLLSWCAWEVRVLLAVEDATFGAGIYQTLTVHTQCQAYSTEDGLQCVVNPLYWTQAPYQPSSLLMRLLLEMSRKQFVCNQHQDKTTACLQDRANLCIPVAVTSNTTRCFYGDGDWIDFGVSLVSSGIAFFCPGSLGESWYQCFRLTPNAVYQGTICDIIDCSVLFVDSDHVPLPASAGNSSLACQLAGCSFVESSGRCLPESMAEYTDEEYLQFFYAMQDANVSVVGNCSRSRYWAQVLPLLMNPDTSYKQCPQQLAVWDAAGDCIVDPLHAPATLKDDVYLWMVSANDMCRRRTKSIEFCEGRGQDYNLLPFIFDPDILQLLGQFNLTGLAFSDAHTTTLQGKLLAAGIMMCWAALCLL